MIWYTLLYNRFGINDIGSVTRLFSAEWHNYNNWLGFDSWFIPLMRYKTRLCLSNVRSVCNIRSVTLGPQHLLMNDCILLHSVVLHSHTISISKSILIKYCDIPSKGISYTVLQLMIFPQKVYGIRALGSLNTLLWWQLILYRTRIWIDNIYFLSTAQLAQWIAPATSNLVVTGSNLGEASSFSFFNNCVHFSIFALSFQLGYFPIQFN